MLILHQLSPRPPRTSNSDQGHHVSFARVGKTAASSRPAVLRPSNGISTKRMITTRLPPPEPAQSGSRQCRDPRRGPENPGTLPVEAPRARSGPFPIEALPAHLNSGLGVNPHLAGPRREPYSVNHVARPVRSPRTRPAQPMVVERRHAVLFIGLDHPDQPVRRLQAVLEHREIPRFEQVSRATR